MWGSENEIAINVKNIQNIFDAFGYAWGDWISALLQYLLCNHIALICQLLL
jgi:hypothetical protein